MMMQLHAAVHVNTISCNNLMQQSHAAAVHDNILTYASLCQFTLNQINGHQGGYALFLHRDTIKSVAG